MQRSPARVDPLRPSRGVFVLAPPGGSLVPVRTEIPIGIDFVDQLHHDELDHDGIIEKTENRDLVGNDVVGFGEIGHPTKNPVAIPAGQSPFGIFEHPDQYFELLHSIGELYEVALEDDANAFNSYARALAEDSSP